MEDIRYSINGSSNSNKYLDKSYRNYITNHLTNLQEDKLNRWSFYESIICEFLWLESEYLIDELKFRLTQNEDPNDVFIDLINRNQEISNYMNKYLFKLYEYKKDDLRDEYY